ncbi:MAG: hypothetical protein ACREXK_10560 [Gammaproteobacteria bacterium]
MAQRVDLARLGGEPLARFAVADERIVNLAEGVLDGALVERLASSGSGPGVRVSACALSEMTGPAKCLHRE